MAEHLVNWFVNTLQGGAANEVIVFIISMLPILELRGGILAGFALGMELIPTFVIAYIGNLIPVPFILLFIQWIFKHLKKTPLQKFVNWCEKRAEEKGSAIEGFAYFGVFLFVAVPLPGTGAWMGALIASMLRLDVKKTFFIIMAGVLIAGIIVSIVSFGLLGSIGLGNN